MPELVIYVFDANNFITFRASMQRDGNFVLYNSAGQAVWTTRTENNPGARLTFGNNCNILISSKKGATLWDSQNSCGNLRQL